MTSKRLASIWCLRTKHQLARCFSSHVRRVFDIGSGSIKCMVAEVDTINRKIINEKYRATAQLLFLPDIEKHGKISDEAKLQAMAIMSKFIDATSKMGVQQTAAIATQAFRQALNGQEIADYFSAASIPTEIVSPEDEGRFGFSSALSFSKCAPEQLIAWDCGAGSFQFTSEKFEHADQHGSGTVRKLASGLLKPAQPFQEGHVEAITGQLHQQLKPFPSWISQRENEFIAIGTAQSIFNQQRILSGSSIFTIEDVAATIKSLLGLDHAGLLAKELEGVARLGPSAQYTVKQENAEYILPKLILLRSVMQKARMPQVQFHETLGNCSALLVHESLWGKAQPKPSTPAAASVTLGDKEVAKPFLTVNWHLEKDCNYKCKFCYAHFANTPANLSQEDGFKLLQAMKDFGIYKVNFAGGEPLLNKNLGPYLRHAKELGLHTSIITNASLLSLSWLREYGVFLDQLGISCDSLDDQINKQVGRGFGHHVPTVARAFQRVAKLNAEGPYKIQAKLNTVVMRQTFREDWSEFILQHNIRRWKIFKILRIEGENDQYYDDHSITDQEFQQFVDRHKHLEQQGVTMAPEDNEDMTETYLMVSPDGKFFQNAGGTYQHSAPILSCGMENGLGQIKFDYSKYQRRGGVYAL